MKEIEKFENFGFCIKWKLLCLGLHGQEEIPSVFTHDDIIDYLITQLNQSMKDDNIINLLCETDQLEKFDELLLKLSKDEISDFEVQKRKVVIVLLQQVLDNIGNDPLQGLLSLMEFWATIGNSIQGPQPFPENTKELDQYFSLDSFNKYIALNRMWLKNAASEILKKEGESFPLSMPML